MAGSRFGGFCVSMTPDSFELVSIFRTLESEKRSQAKHSEMTSGGQVLQAQNAAVVKSEKETTLSKAPNSWVSHLPP
jgi:hypothetical protein